MDTSQGLALLTGWLLAEGAGAPAPGSDNSSFFKGREALPALFLQVAGRWQLSHNPWRLDTSSRGQAKGLLPSFLISFTAPSSRSYRLLPRVCRGPDLLDPVARMSNSRLVGHMPCRPAASLTCLLGLRRVQPCSNCFRCGQVCSPPAAQDRALASPTQPLLPPPPSRGCPSPRVPPSNSP